jgi:hypothetical protein
MPDRGGGAATGVAEARVAGAHGLGAVGDLGLREDAQADA